MHRRYRPWHYEQKIAALTEAIGPQLALGADVMVGFPGETETEFREILACSQKTTLEILFNQMKPTITK